MHNVLEKNTCCEGEGAHKGCCGGGEGISLFRCGCIKRVVGITLVMLALFLLVQTVSSLKAYGLMDKGVYPSKVLNVAGKGDAYAIPDTAEFTASVEEEGNTVKEVQDKASVKAGALLEALKSAGVEAKDIQTVGYTLQPKEEWQPVTCVMFPCNQKLVQKGFTLSEMIQVKVRDVAKAGDLLTLATDKGVARVSGLTFTVADEDGVQTKARDLAIQNAKAKAEALAKELGVKLGRVVGYAENNGGIYYDTMRAQAPMGLGEMSVAKTAVVATGENKVTSNVTVTYEIR